MFQKISNISKGKSAVLYKLLHDSLFVLLVFFVLALIAEGILPGIISSHFGLYKIAILIMLNVLAISGIGRTLEIPQTNLSHKKIVWSLFFISALLIFNSLLKLHIFLNIFILATIFVTGYFLIRVFNEGE